MTQIIDHVDHIVWLSAPDTFDQNREQLAVLAGVPLTEPSLLEDIGCDIVYNASAGIAIVSPRPDHGTTGPIGRAIRRRLDQRGEGLLAVCLGVADLDAAVESAIARGLQPSKSQDWGLDRPWRGEVDGASIVTIGSMLNTVFYLGEIRYKSDVLNLRADSLGFSQNNNHVDHVAWLTDGDSFSEMMVGIGQLTGRPLEGPLVDDEVGMQMALSWNTGIELLAPVSGVEGSWLADMLNADLSAHGPGHHSVIYGVPDIEAARKRVTDAGFQISPMIEQDPRAPWADKTGVFYETVAGVVMGGQFVLGQITYDETVFVTKD